MRNLLAALLGVVVAGCAPHYTVTVYEDGNEKTRVGISTDLDQTMIVIRDNETGVWASIPGNVVKHRLYPHVATQPTTAPSN